MTDRHRIAVRRATAADAERIAALFTDEGYPAGPSDIVERLGRFDSEHSQVLVADHDGEVLGFERSRRYHRSAVDLNGRG